MKNLLFLMCAIVAGIGTVSASLVNVHDNSISEWESLPVEYVASAICPADAHYQALKSVKIYADEYYINILVEPDMSLLPDLEWVPFHVFIDTDNSDATGGYSDIYSDANTDILFESAVFAEGMPYSYNPAVFRWWGEVGGEGWQWVDPNTPSDNDNNWGALIGEGEAPIGASQYVDGMIEMQFVRELIPANWNPDEFGIGVDIQQNWSSVGILPQESAVEPSPGCKYYDFCSLGKAPKLKVKVHRLSDSGTTIDGVTYYLNDEEHTAMVVGNYENLVIPSDIAINGQTYAVTSAFCSCSGTVTLESADPSSLSIHLSNSSASAVYVPCGMLNAYLNASNWRDYTRLLRYAPSPFTVSAGGQNGYVYISDYTACDTEVQLAASAEYGFYFAGWSDGNTDNPRTIELTQDIRLEAVFDYVRTGQCGKDFALTWTFDPASMALNITGKGALSENYTYAPFFEAVTIGNEVTQIGQGAFYGCERLRQIIIGSSVKVLEEGAFFDCPSIETITCYSQRPPTVNNAFRDLDYGTIVYVPSNYIENYLMHDAWGLYDVRPLEATSASTTDLQVTPDDNTVEVIWPAVSGAETYELVIRDKDGNIICTLVFNANGQLTQIIFSAPGRDQAPQQAQETGFAFTVTGLNSGTAYDLTITAKDHTGSTIDTHTASFKTTGNTQGVEDVQPSDVRTRKILRDGHVFIQRGDRLYTATGEEVR